MKATAQAQSDKRIDDATTKIHALLDTYFKAKFEMNPSNADQIFDSKIKPLTAPETLAADKTQLADYVKNDNYKSGYSNYKVNSIQAATLTSNQTGKQYDESYIVNLKCYIKEWGNDVKEPGKLQEITKEVDVANINGKFLLLKENNLSQKDAQ